MKVQQQILQLNTNGRGMLDITAVVAEQVIASKVVTGLCNLFLHHTSASLILCENADPLVKKDLEKFISTLIPDGLSLFEHTAEGPDDMSAHVRTILTQNSLTIPITSGKLSVGTWQGIFLWEHRLQKHQRKMTITIQG